MRELGVQAVELGAQAMDEQGVRLEVLKQLDAAAVMPDLLDQADREVAIGAAGEGKPERVSVGDLVRGEEQQGIVTEAATWDRSAALRASKSAMRSSSLTATTRSVTLRPNRRCRSEAMAAVSSITSCNTPAATTASEAPV